MNPATSVLVVEDEALLAMDIEAMVEDAGHEVVAEGASLHDVEALDGALHPDLAFVDLQLAKGTSGLDVCRLINQRWPETIIVFATPIPPTTSATAASPRKSAENVPWVARLAASASEGRLTVTRPGSSGSRVRGRTSRTGSIGDSAARR